MSQKKFDTGFSHSVARTFQTCRRQRKIRLKVVAAETNIPIQSLRALESGKYEGLPHSVYTLGFVRRYAKFLGLSSQTAAKKYLLERGPLPKPSQRLRRQSIRKPVVGTRAVTWGIVGFITVVILAYVGWQLLVLTGPPRLSLDEPKANQLVNSSEVEVVGTTTPGAEVVVNGQSVYVQDNGVFSTKLNLQSGVNTIDIEARNKRGKSTQLQRTVLVELD